MNTPASESSTYLIPHVDWVLLDVQKVLHQFGTFMTAGRCEQQVRGCVLLTLGEGQANLQICR